jgi:hypothetical protein
MDLKEFIEKGLLDEVSYVVQDQEQATIILESIGYPPRGRPQYPTNANTLGSWRQVCTTITTGTVPGGDDLQVLVDALARRYPSNPIFSRNRTSPPRESNRTSGPGREFVYLLVQGSTDVEQLIDLVRQAAENIGMPAQSVRLEFHNIEGVLLMLENWTTEQAVQLSKQIHIPVSPGMAPVRSNVASSRFEDHLLSRLYVEGPDQARFEINNARASTKVKDIAQGVLETQYGNDPLSSGGKGRRATIDHPKPDGTTERCDPDKTLHESNIRDGDTLQVAQEGTAGSINPIIREEALARVRAQILEFARSFGDFHVQANARHTPTEYTFHFHAPSFGPPPARSAPPTEIDSHEVFLVLSPDFPMKAPMVFWQTPIFHPNVSYKDGEVCLGELGEHYLPGLNFGELCQMLIDIAAYRNYAVTEGYNKKAQEWAVSEDGQIAIEKRGGKSVIRKILNGLTSSRPIQIKRL